VSPSSSWKNRLICGDNLDILPTLDAESVNLIYLDPPFFSNRHYEIIWGDDAEIRSFEDRWEGGINVYIEWMKDRVMELHRVLKPAGTFYLHCDWHASHYLKVMCDEAYFPQISKVISRHSVAPGHRRVTPCAPCTRGRVARRSPAGAAAI
jgi:DNA modification methylase